MATTKGPPAIKRAVQTFGKLIDLERDSISRGAIFRLAGKWPYEDTVDFMLFDTMEKDRILGLIVTTGYKAGLQLVHLPNECFFDKTHMLSTKWIIENWEKWVYPECSVEDVYLIENYPEPTR